MFIVLFYKLIFGYVGIPDSITTIGGRAFSDCENLSSITIPHSVKKIGYGAFAYCENLTSVTFKSAIPPRFGEEDLDDTSIFSRCPNLKTIYVPIGSKEIYKNTPTLSWLDVDIVEVGELPSAPCNNCPLCAAISSGETNIKGRILGTDEPTIFDALEILKFLVVMDCVVYNCGNSLNAALITEGSQSSGTPSIFDALEILKKLVGMENEIGNI